MTGDVSQRQQRFPGAQKQDTDGDGGGRAPEQGLLHRGDHMQQGPIPATVSCLYCY